MNNLLKQLPQSQRWRQQAHPLPVVAAIIRRDTDRDDPPAYLLIKRLQPPYAGQWALVGGKWDFGESLAAAVTREVLEETGVGTDFVAVRGCVSERLFPQNSDDFGAHFVIFVCEVIAAQGEAQEQDEGPVAWFTESEVDELHQRQAMAPTDYLILKHSPKAPQAMSYIEAEVVTQSSSMFAGEARRFEVR